MENVISNFRKLPIKKIAFLQASSLVIYCALVGLVFWKGEEFFGKMNNYLGPVLLLALLSLSVLMCALLVLGYPFILFWEDKKIKEAVRLVFYTAGWLAFFVLLMMVGLVIF
jgi:hypothetical protein